MIVIPFAIIFTLLAIFANKGIRRHNIKLYIAATIISIVAFLAKDKIKLVEPLIQGYLGLSLLYLVMFTGALKDKTKLKTKLAGVRREYSISGFIFLTPHALNYFIEFLSDISVLSDWIGVVAFTIMIPLFITSFMFFRKKFTYSGWKKLQQWAYVSYILIFIHLILVSEMPNLAVYIVLFVPYIVMKLEKEFNIFPKIKELSET